MKFNLFVFIIVLGIVTTPMISADTTLATGELDIPNWLEKRVSVHEQKLNKGQILSKSKVNKKK